MKAKLFYLLLLMLIVFSMNSCSTDASETPVSSDSTQKTVSYSYSKIELDALNIINTHRVSVGLKALVQINYISRKSEEHVNYMIANNIVQHSDFVARSEEIKKALGAKTVGENLAYNYNTPEGVIAAWLNSPSHKENIEGDYTNFGIAIRVNSEGEKYYTNIFVKI